MDECADQTGIRCALMDECADQAGIRSVLMDECADQAGITSALMDECANQTGIRSALRDECADQAGIKLMLMDDFADILVAESSLRPVKVSLMVLKIPTSSADASVAEPMIKRKDYNEKLMCAVDDRNLKTGNKRTADAF